MIWCFVVSKSPMSKNRKQKTWLFLKNFQYVFLFSVLLLHFVHGYLSTQLKWFLIFRLVSAAWKAIHFVSNLYVEHFYCRRGEQW